ncbi:MAG: hypothetical protein LKE33_02680 [Acidaminococcus sp.]|jgi:hypothetical protein|nr:hypothetical protein [Acidaminococcus sp.]MCI2114203.1 hypothetical protein [Acidaminococcus sp.]MCI2116138.1 hypothetical protein [Acidaminococcus sp.]
MGAEEEYVLDAEDFFAQRDIIKKQILDNSKLTGPQKRMTLTVLDAFANSVKAGGVRQHGITKQMLKTALPVFGKMGEDKRHNEKELKVLHVLTMLVYEGLHKR